MGFLSLLIAGTVARKLCMAASACEAKQGTIVSPNTIALPALLVQTAAGVEKLGMRAALALILDSSHILHTAASSNRIVISG